MLRAVALATAASTGAIPESEKGQPGGVAILDGTGKIPANELPPLDHDVGQANGQAAMLALAVTAPAVCIRTDFTPHHVFYLTADPASTLANWVDMGEFGAGGANPTAQAGPTAVNGASNFFMRADAAPAINQAATYSWTGPHTFGLVSTQSAPSVRAASTNPQVEINVTNGGADSKRWNWIGSTTQMAFRCLNDAGSAGNNIWSLVRSGNQITQQDWWIGTSVVSVLTAAGWRDTLPTRVITGVTGNKIWLGMYDSGTGHTNAPKTLGAESTYLQLGGREYGSQGFSGVGFGYVSDATQHPPVWVGHEEIDTAGNTTGDFVVATRNVTTNTAPTERLRVTKTGDVKVPAGYIPATAQSLVTRGTQSVRVIAQSAVASSHTGNTLNTAVATVTVPAGTMGPTSALRITSLWSMTSSANAKTLGMKFGGPAGTNYLNATFTNTASYLEERVIYNRNATNSQVGHATQATYGGFGVSGGAVVTSSIDTTQDADLVFAVQLTNASETVTLEAYTVEVLNPQA